MLDGFTSWPKDRAALYRKEGCWKGETFGDMLRKRAKEHGDRIAVTGGERNLTYADLDSRADQLAAGLQKLGIQKEDRVVIQLPNVIEFFEVIFALFRIGALPVYALPSHRSNEIDYFCEFTEAVAYIIPDIHGGFDYRTLARGVVSKNDTLQNVIVMGEAEEFLSLESLYENSAELLDVNVQSSDVAFLQLSGGSTGLSKLIPRTHDDYMYSLRVSAEICGIHSSTIYLAVLPVAHNFTMSSPGILGTLYGGGRVVLSPGPSPDEAFPLIEKHGVTITALVPPLALRWLESVSTRKENLSSLQVLQVGGAKFSAEAARRVEPAFHCKLQQVFGMAEGLVNYTRLDDSDEIIVNTQGRPMSKFDEIRVVDEEDKDVAPGEVGALLTRGPYTICGYYKAPDHNEKAFTKDGFYRTGDLVSLNPSGYLVVEGRDKDQINRGGEKIAAEEVENHLLAHESVHDAAIVSMPDEFLGERSCAFVIPRGEKPKARELKQFLKDRGLATFKIPDRVEFTEAFPKTPLGKVSKKALRRIITEKLMESRATSIK